MANLAQKFSKLVLFDDMDHYKFFVLKNLVEPMLDYLTNLCPMRNEQSLQASIMIMKERIEIEAIPISTVSSLQQVESHKVQLDDPVYKSTREAAENEMTMNMHKRADEYKSTFLNPGEKFKVD